MKVFYEKNHIKTIPIKFKKLPNLSKRFIGSVSKRLTTVERFHLEIELFKLNIKDKYAKELVSDLGFTRCELVETNEGVRYYVVVLGVYKVKCSKIIYDLSPIKKNAFRTM